MVVPADDEDGPAASGQTLYSAPVPARTRAWRGRWSDDAAPGEEHPRVLAAIEAAQVLCAEKGDAAVVRFAVIALFMRCLFPGTHRGAGPRAGREEDSQRYHQPSECLAHGLEQARGRMKRPSGQEQSASNCRPPVDWWPLTRCVPWPPGASRWPCGMAPECLARRSSVWTSSRFQNGWWREPPCCLSQRTRGSR